jgi:hypothetical protein
MPNHSGFNCNCICGLNFSGSTIAGSFAILAIHESSQREDAMANSWNIEIMQLQNGDVAFRPDLPGAAIGQPLGAAKGDIVTWYNKTNSTLTLQSTTVPGYMTDPIPPGEGSDPGYSVVGSVTYACVKPPQQQHSIKVS